MRKFLKRWALLIAPSLVCSLVGLPVLYRYTHVHSPDWLKPEPYGGPGALFASAFILAWVLAMSLIVTIIAVMSDE